MCFEILGGREKSSNSATSPVGAAAWLKVQQLTFLELVELVETEVEVVNGYGEVTIGEVDTEDLLRH